MANQELIARLKEYRDLLAETEELGAFIKSPGDTHTTPPAPLKKKTFMRFFWPWMVAAIIAFYVVYMATAFIAMQSTIRTAGTARLAFSQMMGDTMAGMICAAIVVIIIILFGIRVAKRKRNYSNRETEYLNKIADEKYNRGMANQKAIKILEEDIIKAHEFEPLVPAGYRTSEKVGIIIDLISSGKAETVEEACAMF